MSRLLVICNRAQMFGELKETLSQLNNWQVRFHYSSTNSPAYSKVLQDHDVVHLLLYSKRPDKRSFAEISILSENNLLVQILYYGSDLVNRQFAKLYEAGVGSCLIGENRQRNPVVSLEKQWERHWKRIPEEISGRRRSDLSTRGKKFIEYIVSAFTISYMALYFNFCEGHFRSKLKNSISIGFGEFKQKVLRHYESILLFERKLNPIDIFESLNYKDISGFSKSFKMRHGKSWRDFKRGSNKLKLSVSR